MHGVVTATEKPSGNKSGNDLAKQRERQACCLSSHISHNHNKAFYATASSTWLENHTSKPTIFNCNITQPPTISIKAARKIVWMKAHCPRARAALKAVYAFMKAILFIPGHFTAT